MCDFIAPSLTVLFIVLSSVAFLLVTTWVYVHNVQRRLEIEALLERAAPNRDRMRLQLLLARLQVYRAWMGERVRAATECQEELDRTLEMVRDLDSCGHRHGNHFCELREGHEMPHREGQVFWRVDDLRP
jgi:hypothetical protein